MSQHRYAPQQPTYAAPAAKPHKKRRVFLWFFLAIQIIFIIWLISAGTTTDHSITHCHAQYLSASECKNASAAGSAIGIGIIVVFWVIVDFLVTIPWAVYRLATRNR